jgi:hypothetical protein
MGQEKAYDTALIRSLQGALEQAKRETDDFKRVKEVYRRELLAVKAGKPPSLSVHDIENDDFVHLLNESDPSQEASSSSTGSTSGTSSLHLALNKPPQRHKSNNRPIFTPPGTAGDTTTTHAPSTASTVM